MVVPEPVRIPLRPDAGDGNVGALLWRPDSDAGRAAFVLAPGAGSDCGHPLLRAVGAGLAGRGWPVLSFNFAYTEAGRRRPDPMARLEAAYRDAVSEAARRLGADRPLVLGGRSLGGRVASHLAASGERCAGLAFLAYPLHPAGRPDRLRTAHWGRLTLPILFVCGDRDRLCDLSLLERERRTRLPGAAAEVHLVRGADHGFAVCASDPRNAAQVHAEVVDALATWADRLQRLPA